MVTYRRYMAVNIKYVEDIWRHIEDICRHIKGIRLCMKIGDILRCTEDI